MSRTTTDTVTPAGADTHPGMTARVALPAAFAVVLAVLVFGPRNAAPLTGLLSMVLAVGALAATRSHARALSKRSALMLASGAAVVAWLVGRAFFAADPQISLLGLVGQHTGAVVWLLALAVLALMLAFPRSDDLQVVMRIAAVLGAAAGLFAVLDAAGVSAGMRYSAEVSGLLESSSSLGQLAVLGLGASVAWVVTADSSVQRASGFGCVAFSLAGFALSQSRAAWVSALLALAVVGVAKLLANKRANASRISAAILIALVVVALALSVWASAYASDAVFSRFAEASNERATIWRSAVAQVAGSPLVGRGAEQFSAWVMWSTDPGVSVNKTGAYDPHNLLIYMLIGGGIPALVLVLALMYLTAERIFRILGAASSGVAAIIAGEVAFVGSLMFAWTCPIALLVGVMMLGALVSADDRRALKGRKGAGTVGGEALGTGVRVAAGIAAVAVLAALSAGVSAEYAWAHAVDAGEVTSEVLLDTAEATKDPSMYAAAALDFPEETHDAIRDAASWHVDAAFELNQAEFTRLAVGSGGSWERLAESAELGGKADPTSGLWDYLMASEANIFNLDVFTAQYAEQALDHPLPDNARAWLEGLRDAGGS